LRLRSTIAVISLGASSPCLAREHQLHAVAVESVQRVARVDVDLLLHAFDMQRTIEPYQHLDVP